MSGIESLSVAPRSFPAQRALASLMKEEAFSQKPSMPLTAPSLSLIMIVRSFSGERAISYDRLSGAMAQSWTSLKHSHVGCRCIHLVRRWMAGRSCRQESTGLEKKLLHCRAVRLYLCQVLVISCCGTHHHYMEEGV